jgi:hypothetical protein
VVAVTVVSAPSVTRVVAPVSVFSVAMTTAVVAFVPIAAITPIAAPCGMLTLVPVPDPLLLHKIHGPTASAVAGAIAAPVLLVKRRNVKIGRRYSNRARRDDHRLRVNHGRRGIAANVDLAVNTGLVDTDGYPHLCIDGRHDASGESECK